MAVSLAEPEEMLFYASEWGSSEQAACALVPILRVMGGKFVGSSLLWEDSRQFSSFHQVLHPFLNPVGLFMSRSIREIGTEKRERRKPFSCVLS